MYRFFIGVWYIFSSDLRVLGYTQFVAWEGHAGSASTANHRCLISFGRITIRVAERQLSLHTMDQTVETGSGRYLGDLAIHLLAVLVVHVCDDAGDGGPHFLGGAHVSAVGGGRGPLEGGGLRVGLIDYGKNHNHDYFGQY